MKLLLLIGGVAASPAIFDDSKVANAILKRQRRNNNGLFEEARAADIVRECHEEICSFDEVLEFYEDQAQAQKFWDSATKQCSEPNACHRPGTATCVNMWRKRRCECRDGYTNTEEADDCSTDIDECATENFCANGGVCTNSVGGFDCACTEGWGGARCEEDINECEADTPVCLNGGECSNLQGSYSCSCPDNWTGDNCEIDVDECAIAHENGENLCEHDGKCMNTQGDFQCLCTNGWSGKTCGEDFDECAAAMCPVGTVCKSAIQSFTCECPERGCNNLDQNLYNEQLSQTFGYVGDSVLEDGSGEDVVEELVEEVIEDSVEDFDNEELVEEETADDYYGDNAAATESNEAVATSEEMIVEDNDQYVSIDDGTTDANAYNY